MGDRHSPARESGGGVIRVRLYIADESPNSQKALANFESIRRRYFATGPGCELEVVDILDEPARAVEDRVLVTPTLINLADPSRRVAGNLDDTASVLLALFGDPTGRQPALSAQRRMLELVNNLSRVESSLDALVADQADAVVHPDVGIPILLRGAQAALKRSEAHYRRLAHHDHLTGLPNRLLLDSRMEHAIAHSRREGITVGLLYLDVDHFKAINDQHGHGAGDRVLREFGRRLQQCVRDVDTVARVGGDEFAILIEVLERADDARRLAVKLIDAISRPMSIEGTTIHTSTSIGIALLPQDARQGVRLLRAADEAMLRAKAKGRGSYEFFNPALNVELEVVSDLETELRDALRCEEFELHYQPEVDLASGRIVAMEALLRWHHPRRGLLLPRLFIAAAENTRLMERIGDWVMRHACRQADQWRRSGHPVRMDINLSARELGRKDLAEQFSSIYAELGIEPGDLALGLEIAEHLLPAATRNADVLRALPGLGIKLTVDRYGRDYSAITVLKSLPIERLKMDREILKGLAVDSTALTITRGLIAMAHGLGLTVGASGVETDEQLNLLRPENCDEAEGFLFSRPLPADAAGALLTRNEPLVS